MQFESPLCENYSMELWFPPSFDEEPTGTDSEYFEVAKLVCSECLRKTECAELGRDERYGCWGGTTPAERRRGVSKPSKRLMNEEAFDLLPERGEAHVDINPLRAAIREVTRKR